MRKGQKKVTELVFLRVCGKSGSRARGVGTKTGTSGRFDAGQHNAHVELAIKDR